MSEILYTILRYGVAVAVGVIIGQLFTIGKVTRKDGSMANRPFIERTSRNFTLVVVLLVTLSLAAVVNTSVTANRQAQCNQEFRRVITENSQLSADSSALQDGLWQELAGYLTTPPVVEGGETPSPSTTSPQFTDITPKQIGESINTYLVEREKAKASRQNYPDAKCNA